MTDPYYAVRVAGLPLMIIQASSAAEIKTNLRRILKKADDIQSIDRMPQSQVRAVFRDAIKSGEVPEAYSPQKHEWGTDDSTEYAKEVTPGERKGKKKIKEFREWRASLKENEVQSADKKPEIYLDPRTGKRKVRLVPASRKVVDKDAEEKYE